MGTNYQVRKYYRAYELVGSFFLTRLIATFGDTFGDLPFSLLFFLPPFLVRLGIMTLHNGMILSKSISSHEFALDFPKRPHTKGEAMWDSLPTIFPSNKVYNRALLRPMEVVASP